MRGLGFQFGTLCTVAGENEESVGKIRLREGAKQIQRALPRLKLRAEENHAGFRASPPTFTNGLPVNTLRLSHPPVVVSRRGDYGYSFFRQSEGQHQITGNVGRYEDLVI